MLKMPNIRHDSKILLNLEEEDDNLQHGIRERK